MRLCPVRLTVKDMHADTKYTFLEAGKLQFVFVCCQWPFKIPIV